jgi:hypothetical protein
VQFSEGGKAEVQTEVYEQGLPGLVAHIISKNLELIYRNISITATRV